MGDGVGASVAVGADADAVVVVGAGGRVVSVGGGEVGRMVVLLGAVGGICRADVAPLHAVNNMATISIAPDENKTLIWLSLSQNFEMNVCSMIVADSLPEQH